MTALPLPDVWRPEDTTWFWRHREYGRPANHSPLARLRQLFLWRQGRICPHDMIYEAVYGDDPAGGPDTDVVKVYVSRLRDAGWDIECRHGMGYICHGAPVRKPRRFDLEDEVLLGLLRALTHGFFRPTSDYAFVGFDPVPWATLEPFYGDALPRLLDDLNEELRPHGAWVYDRGDGTVYLGAWADGKAPKWFHRD